MTPGSNRPGAGESPDLTPDPGVAAAVDPDTVDTTRSMAGKVAGGAKWSALTKLGGQVLQFGVGIVLARLLTPEDFGLLASIYVITGFAVIFFEMGLSSALIHRPNPSEREKSTVFWVNALSGVVYALLCLAAAPLVASFFDAPRLQALMPLVALGFTLNLGVVHSATLQRKLQFRKIAYVELSAAAVGACVTLAAAALGAGAYALALGPLVTSLWLTAALFVLVRWRPRHFADRRSLATLWSFSGGLIGFNVVNYWARNADNLLIGRFLGAAPLAFYARGYNLMLLPIWQITGSLGRVMFPALTAIKGDHARVRSAYLRTLGVVNLLTIPILIGLAAVAEGVVPLLWGGQWVAVVPVLQILCIAGVPQCLATSAGWLYQSQGRTNTMFRVSIVMSTIAVAMMAVGLHWGITGVAWAVLLRSWLTDPISLHLAGRTIGLSIFTILQNAYRTIVGAAVMGVTVWSLPDLVGWDRRDAGVVGLQILVGLTVFALITFAWERDKIADLRGLAQRRKADRGSLPAAVG